jgi:glycosyltransferase involved in cell wall biosynthesis
MRSPTLTELAPPPAGKTGWPWTEATPQPPDTLPDGAPWPRVSVVTPSYNQAQFLGEAIRSVLLQGYPELDYIVTDGGSTDGSAEIIRKYEPWLAYWVSEKDAGQTDAINKGLRRATGELVAYLNSDDLYLPGALQSIALYMTSHPKLGLGYGDVQIVDASTRPLSVLRGHAPNLHRLIHRAEFIPQQGAFWRRAVLPQVGYLDSTLQYCMDYEFFIRASKAFPAGYLAQPLAGFRFHGSSKSFTREEKMWREALCVSERYGLRPWHAWYWIRRLRHWGLRALPDPVERWLRRRMARPQDPQAWDY